jgi:hypothetical protein
MYNVGKDTGKTVYDSLIEAHERSIRGGNEIVGIKNDCGTLKFFKEMSGTQFFFIEKGIEELTKIYATYNAPSRQSRIPQPEQQVKKSHIDDYFEKHFTDKEITNGDIAKMFGITRPTIQEWREKGKLIQISADKKRPIIYDKEKLIEYLKDGIIKDKLLAL